MTNNPYKCDGPLHPVENAAVLMPRQEIVQRVLNGISEGNYWSILGPRQIGKTTLLFQLREKLEYLSGNVCLYILFNPSISNEKYFYERLLSDFTGRFARPGEKRKNSFKLNSHHPALSFYDFLRDFTPGASSGKIVLLFDEADNLPFVKTFLQLWRKVYHDRYHIPSLSRYSVVMAGSKDLISLSIGPNSPYNIAKLLYIPDFSEQESNELIDTLMRNSGISVSDEVKKTFWDQLSGHPQMLQHTCQLLLEMKHNEKKQMESTLLETALGKMMLTNEALNTLKCQITGDMDLRNLLTDILNGEKKKYLPHKDYALIDAGAIAEERSFCKIRNRIFERYLREYFGENSQQEPSKRDRFVR